MSISSDHLHCREQAGDNLP